MVALNRSCPKASRLIELNFAKSDLRTQEDFRHSLLLKQERLRLSKVTGITDQSLLTRLVQQGFSVETIDAIILLPIAMAAWASGKVEDAEIQVAESGIPSVLVGSDPNVLPLFRSWMREKPSIEIHRLWTDFVRCRSQITQDAELHEEGHKVLQLASRVAAAAGGFWGLLKVCSAERQVLQEIRDVYDLPNHADHLSTSMQPTTWLMDNQWRV